MKFSVVIPTLDEEATIGPLTAFLQNELCGMDYELIIADGGSKDKTVQVAKMAGATVVNGNERSRAKQMNNGAAKATGEVLYFLHADTFPPKNFAVEIFQAIAKGASCGCFRLGFDINHWFLNLNCYFTRFDVKYFRWGDQSLFIKAAIFKEAGGFRQDLKIMEDQELAIRVRKKYRFVILPQHVITSSRKYQDNGIIKLQLIFTMLQLMYHFGVSQERILALYKKLIKDQKVNGK